MAEKKEPKPELDEQGRVIRYDAAGDPIVPKPTGGHWVGNQKTG